MMFSATDFLPESIKTLTNLATSTLPYFGSGRISRLGTSRRRGISIPFNLQLSAHLSNASLAASPHDRPLTRPIRGRLLFHPTAAEFFNYYCDAAVFMQPITSWQPWHAWRRTWNAPAYDP